MTRLYLRLLYALLLGTTVLLLCLRVHSLRKEREHPLGRLTRQQVMDRTIPLFRAVSPKTDALILSVEPVKGALGHWWYILSRDVAAKKTASITWNADTDELNAFNTDWLSQGPSRKKLLTSQEAIRKSYSWLKILGIPHNLRSWSLDGLNRSDRHIWTVAWAGEGRRVLVEVEAHSGELLKAMAWQKRVHSGNVF